MKDDTKSFLLFLAGIAIMFLLGIIMLLVIFCGNSKAESIETLVNSYPLWAVSASGDSTFQTVQIVKCRETFPNGQRELLGYKVVVDSSGIRIYEEESVWFLKWAVRDALRLQVELGKQKGELKMQDSKGNVIEPGDKLKSDQSPAGCEDVIVVDISITNTATLEWLRGADIGKRFLASRESLKNSSWVKVEPSHIPAQRGKGD